FVLFLYILFPTANAESFETSIDYTMHKLATEYNDPSAQYLVGRNYFKGKSVDKDIKEAIKWFELAAKQNHIRAQYQLGKIYLYGEGIKANLNQAYYYLSKAAEENHLDSQYELGNYYLQGSPNQRRYAKAVKWFRRAASSDHLKSIYMLGKLTYEGKGTKRNIDEAKRLLTVASDTGLPDATKYLEKIEHEENDSMFAGFTDIDDSLTPSEYYKQGIAFLTDGSSSNRSDMLRKAAQSFQKAATQDHGKAQYQLAKLYKQGVGVEQSEKLHIHWLTRAADAGVHSAIRDLEAIKAQPVRVSPLTKESDENPNDLYVRASKFYRGDDIAQDSRKAARLFTRAAQLNHPDAQYELGLMYRDGIGVTPDRERAKYWLEQASNNDVTAAEIALQDMEQPEQTPAFATPVPVNDKKPPEQPLDNELIARNSSPINAFLERARNGNAQAQYRVGLKFLYGESGVSRDIGQAIKWLETSAQNNYLEASLKLGMLYYKGIDVTQDYPSAATWIEQAANQGDSEAQYLLGNFYRDGIGVEKNSTTAIMWYRKAANQGHREARKQLGGCRIC
ncbi:MAG: tetratricopeptide repeat protein, partial [Gammaproteobacteria bacterium]